MMRIMVLSLVFAFSVSVMGQNYQKISKYLDEEIIGVLSPGVQFLIVDSSGVLFEYNGGYADI